MAKRTGVVIAIIALALGAAILAQEKPKIIMQPPKPVNANDPKGMFIEYCAACHGREGRGNGPAAAALKTVPADLTRVSARNGGTFPTVKVRRYIEGLDEVPAHGSRDMPIWGQVLKGQSTDDTFLKLRIEGLTKYIESIQVK